MRMPGATRESYLCPASVCPAIQATRTCPGTLRPTQLGMLEQETTYLHSLGDVVPDDFCSGADLNTEKYSSGHDESPGVDGWISCYRIVEQQACLLDWDGLSVQSGSCMGGYCCGYSETEQCSSPAPAAGAAMAGEACSSTADCYNDAACLGGRCCSMSQSEYADVEIARYSECTACADSTHDKPGTCVACGTGYHVVTGEETDADIDTLYYLGICTTYYPCSDASQYYTTQYDTCYAKTNPGGACSSSQSYKCSSGLCSNDICCDQAAADSGCTSACDPGSGTCSTRVMAGEACSSTADCYNDAACLGGRCCSMSQSEYADAKPQDTASAPRAQTAPTTSPELAWPAAQGIMWSRARRLTQTSTALYYLGICTAYYPCSDASQYYTTQYDTCYAKTTPGGACSSSQSYRCTSGLCSSNICCDQAAADSGCTSACDPGSGTCSTRVMAGEACSSTADCYNDAACLGGRCCSMSQSEYAELISQDTASAPRAQTAPTTSPELAWPATQGIMWSRARRLTQTSTLCTYLGICTTYYPCSDASQYYTTQYDTCYAKTNPGWCVQLVAIL